MQELPVSGTPLSSWRRRDFLRAAAAAGVVVGLDGALPRAASAADSMLWYSASGSAADQAWSQMFDKKTGSTVDYFRIGGVKLTQRIEEEFKSGNVRSSAIDMSIPGLMSEWANKGLLAKYDSPEAAHYPANLRLPGFWTPINTLTLSMAYNADHIKPEEAPKTWTDLLDPKWKGKMTMSDALYSGAAVQWFSAMRTVYGDEFMQKLAKQDVLIKNGSGDTVDTITSGERPLAAMLLDYYVYEAARKGANLMVVQPDAGVPASYEVIGIPAKAANQPLGQKFVDFALSHEAQAFWQDNYDMLSQRDDVPPVKAVRGRKPLQKLKLLASTKADLDNTFHNQRALLDEWINLFK